MLWLYRPLLSLALLLVTPPLVHLSNAPLPRNVASTAETGLVIINGQIDAGSGRMSHLQLDQGPAVLVEQSLDTVRQFQFEGTNNFKGALPATAVFLFRARTDLPDSAHRFSLPDNESETCGPPRVAVMVDPEYPVDSAAEGTVILQMTTDTNGTVVNTEVIREVPSLTQAAEDAVSAWKFKPAKQDGKATAGGAVAVITFRRPAYTY